MSRARWALAIAFYLYAEANRQNNELTDEAVESSRLPPADLEDAA